MPGYAVTAQFYDPFASYAHPDVDRQIAAALVGLDTIPGPVLDIGAGTGLTSAIIASVLPNAQIWAVEPDPTMRASLMVRVWASDHLRKRVSILPFDIFNAPLPDSISGAVLSASLVHMNAAERERLWASLAERLAERGRIVVEIQCPEAIDVAETWLPEIRVGDITYAASFAARKLSDDQQRWTMTYVSRMGMREVARDIASYDCWAVSANQIAREAECTGLVATENGNLVTIEQARQCT